jgi:DNA-binding transcriptional MerR regulator
MKQVDMSAKAVTARLRRVSQLRRLGLSLQKVKLQVEHNKPTTPRDEASPAVKPKTK